MLYAIVALLVIILDQWTKLWVSGNIALNTGSRELIPGFLNLVNIHNDGAALGFLSGKNAGMLFVILCAVFTIFVIIALATRLIKSSVGRWSLLFIMAGGLSNCIDRLLSGYVQDMFMPTFMDNLPIFNVADIFITLFCLVFILFVLFGGRRDDDYDDEDEDEDEEEELEDDEEEEEELEDEEEDELPPARRPSKYDRAARNGKAPSRRGSLLFGSRDDEEEEEDEEETEEEEKVDEAPAPRREPKEKSAKKTSRRDRQAELDEKYARFKAERAAREQQWSAPQEEAPAVVDPADPFAEWDAAPKKTEKVEPAPAPEVAPAPAPAPEIPAAPVAPPAPKEEPKDESMEFSLEDILAEFK